MRIIQLLSGRELEGNESLSMWAWPLSLQICLAAEIVYHREKRSRKVRDQGNWSRHKFRSSPKCPVITATLGGQPQRHRRVPFDLELPVGVYQKMDGSHQQRHSSLPVILRARAIAMLSSGHIVNVAGSWLRHDLRIWSLTIDYGGAGSQYKHLNETDEAPWIPSNQHIDMSARIRREKNYLAV